MKIIIEYLTLMIPLIWEVSTDLYSIKVKKVPDNHKRDLLPRALLILFSAGLCSLLYHRPYFAALIYSTVIFVTLFDPIMGMVLHRDPLYKSPDSKTDQFIKYWMKPPVEIFVRFVILVTGILCYYQWNLIIS